jgi:hypothetical protein
MADDDQNQQEEQPQSRGARMPRVTSSTVDDDYAYEFKPPKKPWDTAAQQGMNTQSGGMGTQFEIQKSTTASQY